MKRVFIIHGWDGFPENHWFPWLKKELEKSGFKVIIPAMPNSSEPKIETWVSHLKKIVRTLDEETYFVGHSIGCQAIMRYLQQGNFNGKIAGVVFVAGFFKLGHPENEEVEAIAKPWIDTPINFNQVKSKIKKMIVFLSSNEPYGFVEYNAKMFREKLGATVIIEKNKGHFTSEDDVNTLPEVLASINEMNT